VTQQNRIKSQREKNKMSQTQLACIVGVSPSMISKIETGESEGSLPTLRKLAAALGVSLSELIEGPEQPAACLPRTG